MGTMDDVEKLANSFVDDYIVSIELEDGGTFKVQGALLNHASEYFRKALASGRFREGESRTLCIPGCSTETFRLMLYWMCTGELPKLYTAAPAEFELAGPRIEKAWAFQVDLTKLWLVSDMLLMASLQNSTIKCLRAILKSTTVGVEAMILAYQSAPSSQVCLALLREAGGDFLRGGTVYLSTDVDAFGRIPGLIKAVLKSLRRCKQQQTDECGHAHIVINDDHGADEDFYVTHP